MARYIGKSKEPKVLPWAVYYQTKIIKVIFPKTIHVSTNTFCKLRKIIKQ